MNGYLRQSTASQVRTIGAFVDDTDFKTLENALTIANTDIVISINGGADTVKNSGGATAHGAGGIYTLTWDATDTASVGELFYSVKVAGALVVFGSYVVLEEAVYDALYASSAPGYLQPTTAGRTLDVTATGAAGIDWGNIENPTTAQNLSATNIDVDQIVASVSGAVGSVTGAVGSVAAGGITAASIATGAVDADALAADAVAEIADGVWDEDATGHQTGGTFGQAIGDPAADTNTIFGAVVSGAAGATIAADIIAIQADTDDIQARLPGALVSGRIDASVGAMAANVLTATAIATDAITAAKIAADAIGASELAADAVTEIQAGLATAAALATVQADTDDIQARLPAALVGGRMDSSVGAMAADVVTATAIAADAIGSSELAATAVAEIADQVWDEVLAGHLTAGSTGAALNAAGAAGDPWGTALPGAYGAGTAGKIVGDNLNATVSSRATQTSVDDLPTNAELTTALDALPTAAENADAVWDEAVDGAVTARQSLRLANSANGGKLSGAATTNVLIRDLADTKNRVDATVDSSGNRTAVTRDLT